MPFRRLRLIISQTHYWNSCRVTLVSLLNFWSQIATSILSTTISTSRSGLGRSAILRSGRARSPTSHKLFVQVRRIWLGHGHGPLDPRDLAQHACLTLSHIQDSKTWSFNVAGEKVRVDVKGPVTADSAHMHCSSWRLTALAVIRFGDTSLSPKRIRGRTALSPYWKICRNRRAFPTLGDFSAGPATDAQSQGVP